MSSLSLNRWITSAWIKYYCTIHVACDKTSYLWFMPYATEPLYTCTNQMQDTQLDSKYLVSDLKFIHIEVDSFLQTGLLLIVTKQNQKRDVPHPFPMEHLGTWSYCMCSPVSVYIYQKSVWRILKDPQPQPGNRFPNQGTTERFWSFQMHRLLLCHPMLYEEF